MGDSQVVSRIKERLDDLEDLKAELDSKIRELQQERSMVMGLAQQLLDTLNPPAAPIEEPTDGS